MRTALLLALLIAGAGRGEDNDLAPPPSAPLVSGTVKVRYFRTRVPDNANCDASRQLGRISYHSSVLLAGDIELNPGPEPGERPAAGRAAGSSSPPATLTAYHANVRSLKKQLGSLRALAPALTQYDIVSFSKTWLNDTVADSELGRSTTDRPKKS